jgi:hypothetical protein
MSSSSASSFDLIQARTLSRRLAGLPAKAEHAGRSPAYSRFTTAQRPVAGATAAPTPPVDWSPIDMDTWEVLLAWSLELCQARAAFVVDSQGFVIGSRGNVPEDAFEGVGAELCYAMEMLDRVDPEAGPLRAVDLHFAARNLVALRADEPSCGRFVIGFVGSHPLSTEVRDAIVAQLAYSLPNLK